MRSPRASQCLFSVLLVAASACGGGGAVSVADPLGRADAPLVGSHAPSGAGACPVFHCASEATGAMSLPLGAASYPPYWNNATAGTMVGQGCGGDGSILACVFSNDANQTGTLKVFDPIARRELWGSNTRFALSSRAATGQVPYIASNGDIYASDDMNVVRYAADGTTASASLGRASRGSTSFGVIGLDDTSAFVNQKNGVLSVIDLDTLSVLATDTLATANGVRLNLSSPASAHAGPFGTRGYMVTTETGGGRLVNGYLRAESLSRTGASAAWSFPFQGTSGASPVVLTVPGAANPLVLVHTPADAGATSARKGDRLVAIEDQGATYRVAWSVKVDAPIGVAPLIDAVRQRIYFAVHGDSALHALDFTGREVGSPVDGKPYDLRALLTSRGVPNVNDATLNGHIVGTFTATHQTVFLSMSGAAGQLVMGLDPAAGTLDWVTPMAAQDGYTAAWTIAIRSSGGNCPVFVGSQSGINVLCPP
ncbi:MAG: hypothetical protein U0235_02500 [Polyangiaceae bacterium]